MFIPAVVVLLLSRLHTLPGPLPSVRRLLLGVGRGLRRDCKVHKEKKIRLLK